MNAVVPTEQTRPTLLAGGRIQPIIPQTMEDAYRLGNAICKAGMAPRGMEQPEKCMIAILRGLEVGLTPMQALDKIAVVNGRPTIWGDGAMALVRGSGLCEFVAERIDGAADDRVAVCETKRRGEPNSITRTFSVAEAKEAGLWNKAGPWKQFPARMLQMRARAFALRDLFADVLGGLYLREEIEDDRPARNDTPPPAPRRDVERQPAQAVIEHQHSEITAQAAPAAPVKDAEDRGGSSPSESSASDHDENGVVSMESLLTELDERLGFAKTAEDVEEAYTDFDAEPIFSDYEGGVQAARKLKAKHLDRVPAPKADKPAPAAVDDFPGNEALAKLQSEKDPFAIPERFKGGGHYQIFIGNACAAAKTQEQLELLHRAWSQTGQARQALYQQNQLADIDIQRLKERVRSVLEGVAADHAQDELPPPATRAQEAQEPRQPSESGEAPPPAPKAASGDPIAEYTAQLEAWLPKVSTREQLQERWFEESKQRDSSGASEAQKLAWKALMQQRKSALPAEG